MNSSAPPILFSSEAARMSNFCNKSGLVDIYSRYIGTARYLSTWRCGTCGERSRSPR